jgi:hypothetical protein
MNAPTSAQKAPAGPLGVNQPATPAGGATESTGHHTLALRPQHTTKVVNGCRHVDVRVRIDIASD